MKLLDWAKANLILVVAYVVFFIAFWFVGGRSAKMSAATAYFGVIVLHLIFFYAVWLVRKILPK